MLDAPFDCRPLNICDGQCALSQNSTNNATNGRHCHCYILPPHFCSSFYILHTCTHCVCYVIRVFYSFITEHHLKYRNVEKEINQSDASYTAKPIAQRSHAQSTQTHKNSDDQREGMCKRKDILSND